MKRAPDMSNYVNPRKQDRTTPLPSEYGELVEKAAEAIYDLTKEPACNGQLPSAWGDIEDVWQENERSMARVALEAAGLSAILSKLAEVERERDAAQRQFAAAIAQNIMESNKHDFVQAVADLSLTLDADEANPAAYWLSMLTQLRTGAKLIVEHKP